MRNLDVSIRTVLLALVSKEIRKSFHKSVFGIFWHLVVPTAQLYIFFVLYGAINDQIDLFATVAGLFIWFIFNNSMMPAIQQMKGGKNLMMNLKIPVYIIPAASVCMSLIYTSLFILVSIIFMIFLGVELYAGIFFSIPIVALFLFFVYSMAFIISVGNLYFRDIGMLWNSISFLLFLTAPILYPIKVLPYPLSVISEFNPITQFIEALRICNQSDIHHSFQAIPWLTLLSISLFTCMFSWYIHRVTRNNLIANF